MTVLENVVLRLNNVRRRLNRKRLPPERILLLLPHCLQKKGCAALVGEDIRNCRDCGRCKMKELKEMAGRLGIRAHVASGGRDALKRALAPDIELILAVACAKELAEGIRGAFPKRVVGVLNSWPHGACVDTDVDVAAVERELAELLLPPEGSRDT